MRLYRSGQLIRPDLKAHINSQALYQNLENLRSLTRPGTKFCAVVKANAYGHGMTEIVNLLKNDVDFFAVASIFEAIHIGYIVSQQPILILEPVNENQPAEQIMTCAQDEFHCVAASCDVLGYLDRVLNDSGLRLKLHVNIETGMGRCGLKPELAAGVIREIQNSPNLELAGIFTHFANADEEDLSYVFEQIQVFRGFLEQVQGLYDPQQVIVHAANSAATLKLAESHFDMVRCGISLYGYYSRPMQNPPVPLRPVMKLQAPIVNISRLPKGHSISYGRSHVTTRDTVIGLIPLGYADGYFRSFSNRAMMKVGGQFVPVIGRVCMDQLLIDITDVPNPRIGQMVTLVDDVHDSPCGAYSLSELAGTICYEILTCVHEHVSRVVD